MIREILAYVVVTLTGVVLAQLMVFIRKKIKKHADDILDTEILEYLLEGMALAQELVVRPTKQTTLHKLTPQEVQAAKSMAIDHARQAAKGKAKEALWGYTEERLSSMIKLLLNELRRGE